MRHLPSRVLVRRRVAELTAAERHEHLAINTEQVFSVETVAAALPLDRERRSRGIPTRVLGLPPLDGDIGCPSAEELAGLSSEYRERSVLPMKLIVFDRSVAILPIDPLDFERGYLEVAEPAAVATLVRLFYQQWDGAHDPRRAGVPRIVLSPRERAVVAVLASGRTDDYVAKQLNLSRRTIVSTVSGLMDRLGVETRFQLGLVLGAATDLRVPRGRGGSAQRTA
jgi:DNA-binding CsgD family transcriptional regulator